MRTDWISCEREADRQGPRHEPQVVAQNLLMFSHSELYTSSYLLMSCSFFVASAISFWDGGMLQSPVSKTRSNRKDISFSSS